VPHQLDAASDDDVVGSGKDDRESSGEEGIASHVDGLTAPLHDTAGDHIVDPSRVELIAFDEGAQHSGEHVNLMKARNGNHPACPCPSGENDVDDSGGRAEAGLATDSRTAVFVAGDSFRLSGECRDPIALKVSEALCEGRRPFGWSRR
jgi:hypothetical protein